MFGGGDRSGEKKASLKQRIAELEHKLQEVDDARKYEQDKLYDYLNKVGAPMRDGHRLLNACDAMMLYANSLMDERNGFYKNVHETTKKHNAEIEKERLQHGVTWNRARALEAELETERTKVRQSEEGEKSAKRDLAKERGEAEASDVCRQLSAR